MSAKRLPLMLELTTPSLLIGDVEADANSEFDPKTQLSSHTRTSQKSASFNLVGLLSDIVADVAVDDVIA